MDPDLREIQIDMAQEELNNAFKREEELAEEYKVLYERLTRVTKGLEEPNGIKEDWAVIKQQKAIVEETIALNKKLLRDMGVAWMGPPPK